jgi:hypothetical protein
VSENGWVFFKLEDPFWFFHSLYLVYDLDEVIQDAKLLLFIVCTFVPTKVPKTRELVTGRLASFIRFIGG